MHRKLNFFVHRIVYISLLEMLVNSLCVCVCFAAVLHVVLNSAVDMIVMFFRHLFE